MKAVIKIQMDNAAFTECAGSELARILHELAGKVVGSDLDNEYDRHLKVRDINGNTVGELKVSK